MRPHAEKEEQPLLQWEVMQTPCSMPCMGSLGTGWPSLCKTKVWKTLRSPLRSQEGPTTTSNGLPEGDLLPSPQKQNKDEEQGTIPTLTGLSQPRLCSLPFRKEIFRSFSVSEDLTACPVKKRNRRLGSY